MRIGTIDRVITAGKLLKVDVKLEGSIVEKEIVLLVDLGQEYDPVKGDIVKVVEFTSAEGEFAASPMTFKPSSSTSDFLALKQDVAAVNARLGTLEANLNATSLVYNVHSHEALKGPAMPVVPPVAAAPPMAISVTSATIKGSDRLKATHG